MSVWAFITQIHSLSTQGTQNDPKARDNHTEQTSLTLSWWFTNKLASLSFLSLSQAAPVQLYPAPAALPPGLPLHDWLIRASGLCSLLQGSVAYAAVL